MGSTVASTFSVCLQSFERLHDFLSCHDGFSTHVSLSYLEDQLGRLRVWAGNIGAHKIGKVSLDYRLKDASHIRNRIIQLLSDLDFSTKSALSILLGDRAPRDTLPDSDSSTDEEVDTELDRQHTAHPSALNRPTELQEILHIDVPEIINCLYKLSQTIRNAAPHDRYVKSAAVDTAYFEFWDIQHTEGKFPDIPNYLAVRLGKAISRRRQYLMYCEKHRRKLGHDIAPTKLPMVIRRPLREDDEYMKEHGPLPSSKSREPLPNIEPSEIATTVLTQTTATTFTGTGGNVEFELESDSGHTQTSYTPSEGQSGGSRLHPPAPPKQHLDGAPFECPYCFTIINSKSLNAWTKHLYLDLQPYICTFERCSMPDKLFGSRHDWIDHDRLHRVEFFCSADCQQSFELQSEFEEHMWTDHPNTFSKSQLPALARMCQRPLRSDWNVVCQICSRQLPNVQIQRHLARHMEELSLFALPRPETDLEEGLGSDKVEAAATSVGSSAADSDGFLVMELLQDLGLQGLQIPNLALRMMHGKLRVPEGTEYPGYLVQRTFGICLEAHLETSEDGTEKAQSLADVLLTLCSTTSMELRRCGYSEGVQAMITRLVGLFARFASSFFLEVNTIHAERSVTLLGSVEARLVSFLAPLTVEHEQVLNILLREENPINQQLAVSMLEQSRHNVTMVSNSLEVLEASRERKYDAILIDISPLVPDTIDAINYITQIRRREKESGWTRTPIIALSKYDMSTVRGSYFEAGIDGYIWKSYIEQELLQTILTCVSMRGSLVFGPHRLSKHPERHPNLASNRDSSSISAKENIPDTVSNPWDSSDNEAIENETRSGDVISTNQVDAPSTGSLRDDWAMFWKLNKSDLEGMSRKEIERQNVLHETIGSEETYLEDLRTFIDLYKAPLVASERSLLPIDGGQFINDVFSQYQLVEATNQPLFDSLRRRQMDEGPWLRGIADIFMQWIPAARNAYIRFAQGYPRASRRIERQARDNEAFRLFLDSTRENKRSRRLSWDIYLKAPLVRLQRQGLLLKTILRNDTRGQDNLEDDRLTIDSLNSLQHECDAIVAENFQKLQLIDLNIDLAFDRSVFKPGNLGLTQGNRRLLHWVPVEISIKQGRWDQVEAILLDNFLLLVSRPEGRPNYARRNRYDVSIQPIPVELLFMLQPMLENKPPKIARRLLQNFQSRPSPSSPAEQATIPDTKPLMYIRHLGIGDYAIRLSSNSELDEWHRKIAEAKSIRGSFSRDDGFTNVRVIGTTATQEPPRSCPVLDLGSPLVEAIKDSQGWRNAENRSFGFTAGKISCAATYLNRQGDKTLAVGTADGVYTASASKPQEWAQMLITKDVQQLAVLQKSFILLVLGPKSLIAYSLGTSEPIPISGKDSVTYFTVGKDNLIFSMKAGTLSTTVKMYENVSDTSTEKSVSIPAAGKARKTVFRKTKEFYLPSRCYSITPLRSTIAICAENGIQVVSLDTLEYQSLLDTKSNDMATVMARVQKLKPLAVFRLPSSEFLVCYNECAIYINRHGILCRNAVMEYVSRAESAIYTAYKGGLLVLFHSDFVEVRRTADGVLCQIIPGANIRCLNEIEMAREGEGTSIKLVMANPRDLRETLVVEMATEDGDALGHGDAKGPSVD